MTFATGLGFQRNYGLYPDTGLEGMIDNSIPHDVDTLVNGAGMITQVSKITVGTAADSTLYSVSVVSTKLGLESTVVSYTSDASATPAEIQAGLISAINASVRLASHLKLTKDGNDILVASRTEGKAGEFTLSVSGGGTGFAATVDTTAADAGTVEFGRLLWQRSTDPGRNARVVDGAMNLGVLRGFSVRTEVHESPYPGQKLGYLPKMEMNALTKGRMQIRPVTDMHPTSPIHVYITGENQGRLRASADGANTVQYTGTGIRMYEPVKANQIGRVEVNLP